MSLLSMKTNKLEVTKITGKTQAKLFKDISVGDVIQLSVPAETVGGSRGRSYAVYVKVENLTTGDHRYATFNRLMPLDNFEFKDYGRSD